MSSRRAFLKTASAGALAAFTTPSLFSAGAGPTAVSVPGKEGLIVRSFRFLDLETPVEFMTDWITPVPHFFVRNHMFEPVSADANEWKLAIGGEVDRPLSLTLADLAEIPVRSVTNTLSVPAMVGRCKAPKFRAFSGARARSATRDSPGRA